MIGVTCSMRDKGNSSLIHKVALNLKDKVGEKHPKFSLGTDAKQNRQLGSDRRLLKSYSTSPNICFDSVELKIDYS